MSLCLISVLPLFRGQLLPGRFTLGEMSEHPGSQDDLNMFNFEQYV